MLTQTDDGNFLWNGAPVLKPVPSNSEISMAIAKEVGKADRRRHGRASLATAKEKGVQEVRECDTCGEFRPANAFRVRDLPNRICQTCRAQQLAGTT